MAILLLCYYVEQLINNELNILNLKFYKNIKLQFKVIYVFLKCMYMFITVFFEFYLLQNIFLKVFKA